MTQTYTVVETLKKRESKLAHIYYDSMGKKHIEYVDFSPKLALPINIEKEEESGWNTLDGRPVKFKTFDEFSNPTGAYWDFLEQNREWLEIHGEIAPQYQFIQNRYPEINYNLKHIKTLLIDIEVYSEKGFPDVYEALCPITSISVKDVQTGRYYVAALKDYKKKETELDLDYNKITFRPCKDDAEILRWFIFIVKQLKPDIMIGWYSDGFDFPYIINRMDGLLGDNAKNMLSPLYEQNKKRSLTWCEQQKNGEYRCVIRGITLFDYLRLYKKFTFKPRQSYALDAIASIEVGENKIDYSEYGDLNELWDKNPQKYIDYNIYDVELIDLINKKMGLIDLALTIAYESRSNPIDVMGTIRVWDNLIYDYLTKRNIVIPPIKENSSQEYAGAYVKTPECDIYKWVVSYDLNSLYPHLQQQFNISPDCIVDGKVEDVSLSHISTKLLNCEIDPDPNYILAGNGQYFRKDIEGFIPKILRGMYDTRSVMKKEMLSKKQELVDVKEEMKRRGIKVD